MRRLYDLRDIPFLPFTLTGMQDKLNDYCAKIDGAIRSMFEEDSDYHINQSDFENSENATAFIHALTTMVPAVLYNQLTGEDVDMLGFNHIANRLCFQFSKEPA